MGINLVMSRVLYPGARHGASLVCVSRHVPGCYYPNGKADFEGLSERKGGCCGGESSGMSVF